uniref:Acetylajmalan esterase-like n=1 Tax=Nicotiana sylvestris TaxID=4096 RepID=A0A1U7VH96_NICSY|nr:PREDICTED: acetylajmalan esterase-like [Nicotiana sylvestris]
MASLVLPSFFLPLSFLAFAYAANNNSSTIPNTSPYEFIFHVGDSLADTGNLVRLPNANTTYRADHYPYGRNYFGEPTGRFSDGRLTIDYIAKALNLRLLKPYLQKEAKFSHGVNFAVGGSTVLRSPYYETRNISMPTYNRSLKVQHGWLTTYLKATCYTLQNCSKVLGKSLFMFGEIGGNVYYQAFSQGKSIEEVKTYVPYIAKAIVKGIKQVMK